MPKYLVDQDKTVVKSKSYCVEAESLPAAIRMVKDGKVESHSYTEYPVLEDNETEEYRYCDSMEIDDEEWDRELAI